MRAFLIFGGCVKKAYNKLVRDKIPEIIQNNGEVPKFEILDSQEYLSELHKKLFEEANEFVEEDSQEELADLLEVIYAIAKHKNIDLVEVEKIRVEKSQKRGAFEKRIFLKSVDEKDV